ncbi:MAG: hypothetical protein Q9217_006711 [Psora testacea]
MAIETKAASTSCANSKYKKPKPPLPATNPKYIQNLWQQVRKQKREHMSYNQQLNYMADTAATARKKKVPYHTPTTVASDVPISFHAPSTAPTSNTQFITIKNPYFREECLMPRGITFNDRGLPPPDPFSHFHTEKPLRYRELEGLKESTLWLNTDPLFIENVNKEYKFMNHYQLCEAEYASFAKENLLKREPREAVLDNTMDASQRFRRAERMLEFVCKPNKGTEWEAPPLLSLSGVQEYPTYTFDVRPDCSYWLSLHAFSSWYAEQAQTFLHIPQDRMTCPYLTVEFKRDDNDLDKAIDQAATSGALALYNRYRLRNRAVSDGWTHEQECQLRHYVLTITKSKYKFWCIRPSLKDGKWNGCDMAMIFVASMTSEQGVKSFVNWINEIHRWGLTSHIESCEKDVRSIAKKHNYRVSLEGVTKKECTCKGSLDAEDISE